MKYKYCLANVWWNKSGIDQPLFFNHDQLKDYFESVRTEWGDLFNFTIGDGVNTSIYIQTTLDTNDVLDYHYVIVVELTEDGEELKRYHYHATISQDSGNQYYCDLERDVIIDYYNYGDVRKRPYTMINRTHLDRFKYNPAKGEYRLNGDDDSPLYIAEDITTDTPICEMNQLINIQWNDNADMPIMYGLTQKSTYIYLYFAFPEDNAHYNPYFENGINQNVTVFAFPYTSGTDSVIHKLIHPTSEHPGYIWDITNFFDYAKSNNLLPYLVNMRISPTSPFGTLQNSNYATVTYVWNPVTQDYELDYTLKSPQFEAIGELVSYNNEYAYFCLTYNGNNTYGYINHQTIANTLNYLTRLALPTITLDYIKSPKSWHKEPKLYNGLIKCNIALGNNSGKEYNLLYLYTHQNDNWVYYTYESLVPGITRLYHGLVSAGAGFYNLNNFFSFNAISTTMDTSIPFSVNQYESFLAQNKNFYQQTNLQYMIDFTNSTLNNLTSVGLGLTGRNYGSALGGAVNIMSSEFNMLGRVQERNFKTDNLRNAPPTMHNLDGNPLLALSISGMTPRVEVWKPAQSNLEKIADYLFYNGYNFNKVGRLNEYDSTRYYFNYIQADIYATQFNMNNKAYDLLHEKLLQGVRLWHANPVDVDFRAVDNGEIWAYEDSTVSG